MWNLCFIRLYPTLANTFFGEVFAAEVVVAKKGSPLTHVDVWGKYETASINKHQYYVVMIDDAS